MSRMKRSLPALPRDLRPTGADAAAGLRMLAAQIGELVGNTSVPALETALDLALAGPADLDAARRLADEIAERSARLDDVIGRTLLTAPIA